MAEEAPVVAAVSEPVLCRHADHDPALICRPALGYGLCEVVEDRSDEGGRVGALGIGGHQSHRMLSDTWLTPPEILAALGPFDLDPCAAPEPRPWPSAARHITRPDDGLEAAWSGRVWLNPPYGDTIGTWMGKLARHGHGTALVFARTETSWFVESVWQEASAALFLHGRIHFCRPDGFRARMNSGAPSVLVAYGERDAERLRDCGLAGTFVRWQAQATGAFAQPPLFGLEAS